MNYPENKMPPLEQERIMSHLLSILCMAQESEKAESNKILARHYQIMIADIENVIGRHKTFILENLTVLPNF
jgi:hypothetical protein